jgi:thiol-disulfide isomerase/thioredoxin
MTIFPVVELNPSLPDTTFVFSPPAQAKLVGEFPSQKRERQWQEALRVVEMKANEDLLGKPAPDWELKTVDGKVVALSSYRGKPVLIDVWATWCGPCLAMIPELNKLSNDLSAQGVVFLSVDVEDDADAAANLLKEHDVPWQNLHDGENQMSAAFHTSQAVPWQILLNSEGKLAFYQLGEDVAKLRAAVAALGPQYSGILVTRSAPK